MSDFLLSFHSADSSLADLPIFLLGTAAMAAVNGVVYIALSQRCFARKLYCRRPDLGKCGYQLQCPPMTLTTQSIPSRRVSSASSALCSPPSALLPPTISHVQVCPHPADFTDVFTSRTALYQLAAWTYVLCGFHFATEVFVFRTIALPVVISGIFIIGACLVLFLSCD